MIDKQIKKKDLEEAVAVSANILEKMGRSELVSLDILVRICHALHCDIGEIMEVLPESPE